MISPIKWIKRHPSARLILAASDIIIRVEKLVIVIFLNCINIGLIAAIMICDIKLVISSVHVLCLSCFFYLDDIPALGIQNAHENKIEAKDDDCVRGQFKRLRTDT